MHMKQIFRVRRPWNFSPPCRARPLLHDYSSCYHIIRTYSRPTANKEAEEGKGRRSDPLRILFCGSDDFSGASLKALHDEHRENPELIESIGVVVRPGKPTGRGYKVIREPPVKALAASLGLPIHERDTFTGWDMPPETNLIIAVSFGLFVPRRLLRAATYGGLNVHPSLLPAYRGPAPLHHVLLDGVQTTGVSLQTLDEVAFDRGVILARRVIKWGPDSRLKIPSDCTVLQLQEAAAAVGAQLLVSSLRKGLHVPPLKDVAYTDPSADPAKLQRAPWAPKLTPWDRQVPPWNWVKPKSLAHRQRIIGPLWFKAARKRYGSISDLKRIIIEEAEQIDMSKKTKREKKREKKATKMKVSFPPTTSGKWSYRKLHRWYQEEPPKANEGEQKAAVTTTTITTTVGPKMVSRTFYYWTHPSDDAIYISPGNPPSQQRETYVRIPLLKVEGEKAKPATQVAASFSSLGELSGLTWARYQYLKDIVDYDLHVAFELEGLRYATALACPLLLPPSPPRPLSLNADRMALDLRAWDGLERVLDKYNPLLATIGQHWAGYKKKEVEVHSDATIGQHWAMRGQEGMKKEKKVHSENGFEAQFAKRISEKPHIRRKSKW